MQHYFREGSFELEFKESRLILCHNWGYITDTLCRKFFVQPEIFKGIMKSPSVKQLTEIQKSSRSNAMFDNILVKAITYRVASFVTVCSYFCWTSFSYARLADSVKIERKTDKKRKKIDVKIENKYYKKRRNKLQIPFMSFLNILLF